MKTTSTGPFSARISKWKTHSVAENELLKSGFNYSEEKQRSCTALKHRLRFTYEAKKRNHSWSPRWLHNSISAACEHRALPNSTVPEGAHRRAGASPPPAALPHRRPRPPPCWLTDRSPQHRGKAAPRPLPDAQRAASAPSRPERFRRAPPEGPSVTASLPGPAGRAPPSRPSGSDRHRHHSRGYEDEASRCLLGALEGARRQACRLREGPLPGLSPAAPRPNPPQENRRPLPPPPCRGLKWESASHKMAPGGWPPRMRVARPGPPPPQDAISARAPSPLFPSSPPLRVSKRRLAPIASRRCSSWPPSLANRRVHSYIRIRLSPIRGSGALTSLQLPPIDRRSSEKPMKSLRSSTCVYGWPIGSAWLLATNGGAVRGAQSGRGRAPGASRGGQWEFEEDRFCSTACYWARRWRSAVSPGWEEGAERGRAQRRRSRGCRRRGGNCGAEPSRALPTSLRLSR